MNEVRVGRESWREKREERRIRKSAWSFCVANFVGEHSSVTEVEGDGIFFGVFVVCA